MDETHEAFVRPLVFADPDRVGPFMLLGRLGGGGMGTVFLARSEGGRIVALKMVHEHLAREPEFRLRFRLEAEAARTIGALHGTAVVAADTQTTVPWLATEYVLGPALSEAVEHHGPLPEPAVRALGVHLARALAGLHGAGLVHRDLKPSNILITATGPRVIDFGIARALGARRLTRSGQAVGTPSYMSPEQARGHDHEPPGDVFALGGLLVFAATGHAPFPGEQAADVLHRVQYEDPDLSSVPPGLLAELSRCLAKDPDDRPGPETLAQALAGDDRDFASLLPGSWLAEVGRRAAGVWELRPTRLPGPPAPPPDPAPEGPSRRRLLVTGGTGLLALGVGGAVWASHDPGAAGRPRPASSSRAPGVAPEPLWTYRAKEEAAVAAVRDGIVVVSVGDVEERRSAVGLDARTGKVRWRQPRFISFEEAGTGSFVRGQPQYPGDGERPLRLDTRTGELQEFTGELKRLNVQEGDLLAATADLLYVRSEQYDQGYAIAAFAADTGQRRRLTRLKTEQPPLSGAVVDDLLIYCTAKEVAAVATTDGKERWRVRPPRGIDTLGKVHRRSIADGRLYIGGTELHALDTATGKTVWRFGKKREASTGGRSLYGTPSVVDGVVYVTGLTTGDARTKPGSANDFLALRASDGHLLWSYPLHTMTKTWPPPAIHGGILYRDMTDVPQPLLAVDLKTHRPPWTFRSGIPNDGKAPVDFTVGRTALALASNRLHLSCATTVVTLPADR